MHIPDGFLSPAVWAPLDAAAIPAVGWIAHRAQKDTDERNIPLMGVMGAFVFAAQMINFPVGLGTSGHLVGGALLAIVLGPAAASVVLTSILVIQAFVFQDGGIMALGPNILNMAIVGGAILPVIQGVIADRVGIHHAFILPVLCYLYILYYGISGSKANSERQGIA